MAKRIRAPRYGMMVTDATGLWMLISRRHPIPKHHGDDMIWLSWRFGPFRAELLLLDPDQFGEVE